MRQEIAVGLRYVTGHRWLRSIAATTGTSNFFGNVFGAILILYLTRERGLGPAEIGFAFSIGSLGVLLAALVTGRITRRLGVGRTLVLMAIGFSLSGLPVAFAPDAVIFWAVALSGFLGGFCGVGWNINQVSLRQAITPPRMQGKMNATMRFIVWGTMPIGAIIGGALGGIDRPPGDDRRRRAGRAGRVRPGDAVVGPPHRDDAGPGGRRAARRRPRHPA